MSEPREPKIGDVIRAVKPWERTTRRHKAGDYGIIKIRNHDNVETAIELIASGRWVLVEQKGIDQ